MFPLRPVPVTVVVVAVVPVMLLNSLVATLVGGIVPVPSTPVKMIDSLLSTSNMEKPTLSTLPPGILEKSIVTTKSVPPFFSKNKASCAGDKPPV